VLSLAMTSLRVGLPGHNFRKAEDAHFIQRTGRGGRRRAWGLKMDEPVPPESGIPPEWEEVPAPGQSEQPASGSGSLPASAAPGTETPSAARDLYVAFYREFVPRLVAYLVFQGASLGDAADVAQEAMIEAYQHWPEIEHPRAWVRRVASRKYGRRIVQVGELPDPVASSPLLPSGLDVARWEQGQEVLRLLAELPLRQRQVMAMTYDGDTASEIAAELNMTVDAVRANLMRARRTLAAKLGVPEGGPQ
jgi:RNA polymerase sigma factor (sigma-70 family)